MVLLIRQHRHSIVVLLIFYVTFQSDMFGEVYFILLHKWTGTIIIKPWPHIVKKWSET
jgi:hypothetical protein